MMIDVVHVHPRSTKHQSNMYVGATNQPNDQCHYSSGNNGDSLKQIPTTARPRAASNTSATNTSTKNGTVTTATLGHAEGGTAVTMTPTNTKTADSSDNALQAILDRNQRRVQEAEQRREAKRNNRKSFLCCTVPLYVLFGIQIAVVVAVFIAIIVAVNATTVEVTSDLISDGINSALLYAGSEITSPIAAAEGALSEFRNRYLAQMVLAEDHREPCNDESPLLGGSAAFYADVVMMLQSYPLMGTFFAVKRVVPLLAVGSDGGRLTTPQFAQIANDISLCSVTDRTVLRRLANTNTNTTSSSYPPSIVETTRLPDIAELSALDTAVPVNTARTPNTYGEHEDGQVAVVLATPRFTWIPRIRLNPFTNATQYTLIGTAPISVNITTTSSAPGPDPTALSAAAATTTHTEYLYASSDRGTSGAFTVGINGVLRVDVVSGLGCVLDLSDFAALLRQITPRHPLAHTSLYVTYEVLLTTSYFTQETLSSYAGEDYPPAGNTQIVTLDFANHVCGTNPNMVAGTVFVFMDGLSDPESGEDVIVSCYAFALPISNKVLAVVQSTPRSHYFAPVSSLRAMLISLGVCSAVVVVCISAGIAIAVNIGVSQVIANMAIAAAMKGRETIFIRSFIAEVEQLAKGFGHMNNKLVAALPYLPQHLLATTDESGDEGGHGDDNEEEGTAARSHLSARHTSAAASSTGHSGTNNSSSNPNAARFGRRGGGGARSNGSGSSPKPNHQAALGGVAAKRVTLLAINGRYFHNVVNVNTPTTIHKPSTQITQLVVEVAHGNKGIIDSFHGDHFVVSFNAARHCAEGPLKASSCALDLLAANHSVGMTMSMGISTGRACVGNLGCATAKRLSIIGPVYSKAMALEKLCRRFNAPFGGDMHQLDINALTQCVVDSSVASEVHHSFLLQVLGGVYGTPFAQPPNTDAQQPKAPISTGKHNNSDGRPTNRSPTSLLLPEIVYALRMQMEAVGGDEWLYEMQNNKHGPMNDLNKAMMGYVAGCAETLMGPPPATSAADSKNAAARPTVKYLLEELSSNLMAVKGQANVVIVNEDDDGAHGDAFAKAHSDGGGDKYAADDPHDDAYDGDGHPHSGCGALSREAVFSNCLRYAQFIATTKFNDSLIHYHHQEQHEQGKVEDDNSSNRLFLNGCPAYNCRRSGPLLLSPPAIFTI